MQTSKEEHVSVKLCSYYYQLLLALPPNTCPQNDNHVESYFKEKMEDIPQDLKVSSMQHQKMISLDTNSLSFNSIQADSYRQRLKQSIPKILRIIYSPRHTETIIIHSWSGTRSIAYTSKVKCCLVLLHPVYVPCLFQFLVL